MGMPDHLLGHVVQEREPSQPAEELGDADLSGCVKLSQASKERKSTSPDGSRVVAELFHPRTRLSSKVARDGDADCKIQGHQTANDLEP